MASDYLKCLLQYSLPKKTLTTLCGILANSTHPAIKNPLIRAFIRQYNVDMSEAKEENPEYYATFNDFFIRHLKPNVRPIADNKIISPVDGYISEIGAIHEGSLIQAKGRDYSVEALLTSEGASFKDGLFATLYLSPSDYHRVHMPLAGTLKEMIYVPGALFSVQPATTRRIPNLFARNERLVVFFDTDVGLMAMVLVGATIVGAIGTSWQGDIKRRSKPQKTTYAKPKLLRQADEMGYFKLGSTVILLFADRKRVRWQEGLCSGDKIRFGQELGRLINK